MMTATSAPEPGTTIGGKFRVVRLIGQGGMGAVLEAENTLTGKRVAIKWMNPLASTEPVDRFLQEARAASRVRHPNVVDVYDFVQEDDRFLIVMELLEGEPLTALLERGGMPLHELVGLLLDAMRGVAAAHAQGVIHRDIKPDNVFLERQPDRSQAVPKVIDFGVSKLVGEGLSLTRSGATLGTPLYMSFEQLRGARDVDARADVYSFGVILYEAMTGQPPFHADTLTELVVKITTTEPLRAKILRPDLPTSLDHLIHWAMAIDREQRLPTMHDLIRELEPYTTEHGFRAQMTIDGATMPRLVAQGPEYVTHPSERPQLIPMLAPSSPPRPRSSAPRALASTPPAGVPRAKGRVWLWAGVVALLAGAGFMFVARTPGGAPGEPPAPSSAPPSAASDAPAAEVPTVNEEPAPVPAAPPEAIPAAPAPSAAVHLAPTPPDTGWVEPASDKAEPRASDRKAAKRRPPRALAPALAAPAAPAPPKEAPEPTPEPPKNFRAGRPLSEDF
jgi:eukaryotic-like serine/threonine-protein kinase